LLFGDAGAEGYFLDEIHDHIGLRHAVEILQNAVANFAVVAFNRLRFFQLDNESGHVKIAQGRVLVKIDVERSCSARRFENGLRPIRMSKHTAPINRRLTTGPVDPVGPSY